MWCFDSIRQQTTFISVWNILCGVFCTVICTLGTSCSFRFTDNTDTTETKHNLCLPTRCLEEGLSPRWGWPRHWREKGDTTLLWNYWCFIRRTELFHPFVELEHYTLVLNHLHWFLIYALQNIRPGLFKRWSAGQNLPISPLGLAYSPSNHK